MYGDLRMYEICVCMRSVYGYVMYEICVWGSVYEICVCMRCVYIYYEIKKKKKKK